MSTIHAAIHNKHLRQTAPEGVKRAGTGRESGELLLTLAGAVITGTFEVFPTPGPAPVQYRHAGWAAAGHARALPALSCTPAVTGRAGPRAVPTLRGSGPGCCPARGMPAGPGNMNRPECSRRGRGQRAAGRYPDPLRPTQGRSRVRSAVHPHRAPAWLAGAGLKPVQLLPDRAAGPRACGS
jgi:hypothetical protein